MPDIFIFLSVPAVTYLSQKYFLADKISRFSFWCTFSDCSPGEEHDPFLKQELIKRMLVCYPNDFQDDEPARNHCRDLIIESASLALQVSQLSIEKYYNCARLTS